MSANNDEMVFGDVAYREPRRLRRPDRDRKYACLAYEVPGAEDMPIFLDREVADRIERHALSDTSVELGGILLGHECVDDQTGHPFVWISRELEARHYENTQASFTYTHESWEEITRERDKAFPDLDIVGWYHTHPDFGIFLSGHDQFIHNHFFAQPLQVAYVVDPIRRTRGFFVWKGGKLVEVGGYFIVSPRDDRPRLAKVVDDLEGIEPEDEPGGAGITLTPRLEAELMSMLRRTAAPMSYAPPDRGQTAAVFTLLGLVAGALGLALALWIGSLTVHVRRQAEEMAGLRQGIVDAKRLAKLDEREAAVAASEDALSVLLREVQVGGSPDRFVSLYQEAIRDRDKALARAAMADQVGKDLISKDTAIVRLEAELTKQTDRAKATAAKLARLEKEAESDKDAGGEADQDGLLARGLSPTAQWGLALMTLLVGLLVGWLIPRRPLLPAEDLSRNPTAPSAPRDRQGKASGDEYRIGED